MRRTLSMLTSTAAVAAVLTAVAVSAPATAAPEGNNGRTKNVIYLLGDGMGRTHVTAGRERFYGAAGKLAMETLPAQGYVSTYAVEKNSGQPGQTDFKPNLVTDSASAATAWASGVKTYNAALGVDAKGAVVPTMMELAKKAGYRTGNVSTAEITDATPASQMSHSLARGCQGPVYSAAACQDTSITGTPLPTSDVRVTPIADQIARNGTADVIFGGGLSRFDATDETALKEQGYSVLGSVSSQIPATRADLNGAAGEKVFGLFNKGNLTVEKAKQDNPAAPQAQEPSLPEMTKKAIELLDKKKEKDSKGDGFYLQIEGALIDKRSHANDAAQALEEIKAFDDSVAAALDFAKKDGNTLVIVTADHETGGFSVIEKGSFTNAEAAGPPANVDSGNTANSSTPTRPGGNVKDPTRSSGIINGAGAADPKNFGPATFRTPNDPAEVKDGSKEASLWLNYLSGNHTGADVPVYAYGSGSEQLQGSVDNTDLFDIVGNALRVLR
ncbi:Alkaline phosphatase (plasmid) [Arthrobacter sp. FB24]|uniref:alkaline phosphatase n=1 Tax=Arthrobacter sp. (strain FB24) TaxID=290399 RepID=UPI00005273CF|nr:alkaline phosphatase [Arthrobacter sp. FB24]ABK05636.1 Alkaline phosphatase [Arthrobacter sp. FB24]ABK05734.1 Alkaline phosphatase [Arthrobacter sp. FB24]ABK05838.1 Alkaline phosphatase [Arthrobacter sp. FB24]